MKKRVAVNYLYNSIFQIFLIIVPLITAPYLARTLQAEALGVNSFVSSIINIFSVLGLIGLTNYSIREIAYVREDKKKLSKVFTELMIIRCILFIITTSIYLIYSYNSEYAIYFYINLFTMLSAFFDFSWVYHGFEDFKIIVIRNFTIKILNVITILLFIKKPDDLVLFTCISCFFAILSWLSLSFGLRKRIGHLTFKKLEFKRHIIQSLKLFMPQIASLIYLQVDKIMLEGMTTNVNNVGFYDQAERLIKVPIALITALAGVMLPRLSNEYKNKNFEQVKKYMNLSFRFSVFLAIPLMFGLAVIASTLIPWFYGPGYEKVATSMMMLCPIVFFISMSSVTGSQYLTATNKTRVLTIASIISAVVNLIINFIFIPKFNVLGAAFGTVIAELLMFTIQYWHVKKDLECDSIWKYTIKYLLVGLIMFVACNVIGSLLGNTVISTLAQIVTGIVTYFGILFIIKDSFLFENLNNVLDKIKEKIYNSKSRK